MKPKFKIKDDAYTFRNIRFPIALFNKINKAKGKYSFTKFVIEACKYALDNME